MGRAPQCLPYAPPSTRQSKAHFCALRFPASLLPQDEASQWAFQPFLLELYYRQSGAWKEGLPCKVHCEGAAWKGRFWGGLLCGEAQRWDGGGCEGGEQGREGDDGRGQHSFGGRPHAAASRRSRSDQAVRLLWNESLLFHCDGEVPMQGPL